MNTPIEHSDNEQKPPQNQAAVPADNKSPETLDAGSAVSASQDVPKAGNVFTKGLLVCGNCGTELLGETCYQCGQPTKGLVRQFSSILGDFLDTVLNIDSRVFRTLGPLIFKPGYLTQEYFSGRRIRFVSPVRLFFFLAVLTFLFAQFSLPEHMGSDNDNDNGIFQIDTNKNNGLAKANTIAEVEKIRAEALADMDLARKEVGNIPMAAAGLEKTRTQINKQADKRIAQLIAVPAKTNVTTKADAPGIAATPDAAGKNEQAEQESHISFNGDDWDAVKNPITLTWLPDSVNTWLNSLVQRAENNGKRVDKDPKVIIEAVLSSLPMTLFLMLPVFALLLKMLFIFKRRLYMEHLIVALHSHAFLMLAILILILFGNLSAWLGASSWLNTPVNFLTAMLWLWMPIYLFLMQKRVYQQGWILTFIKYAIIGNLHIMLLSVAIGFTLIIKMIWL